MNIILYYIVVVYYNPISLHLSIHMSLCHSIGSKKYNNTVLHLKYEMMDRFWSSKCLSDFLDLLEN